MRLGRPAADPGLPVYLHTFCLPGFLLPEPSVNRSTKMCRHGSVIISKVPTPKIPPCVTELILEYVRGFSVPRKRQDSCGCRRYSTNRSQGHSYRSFNAAITDIPFPEARTCHAPCHVQHPFKRDIFPSFRHPWQVPGFVQIDSKYTCHTCHRRKIRESARGH